ncbi:MAG TPA: Fic/DOC family N-terminal domain-containing protein [Thermoanaerobaculia bacterium]|nr:Fic/DOC family N-terminal domain-containing protein [Thermoanaerobaculia bacterium]
MPSPLPPEIDLSWRLLNEVARAERAVGHLRGLGRILPNPHLLIQPFARREAVLSSRIEGTQASRGALLELREDYRSRVTEGRHSALLLGIIDRLFQSPVATITGLARDVGASYPAAKQNVEKLLAAGILEPVTETRNRIYMARRIVELIEAP